MMFLRAIFVNKDDRRFFFKIIEKGIGLLASILGIIDFARWFVNGKSKQNIDDYDKNDRDTGKGSMKNKEKL